MKLTANIKDTQKELLVLLVEFDRVCRQNQIRYSLHGGTLLGAIRHKGFIPWDDDIDVTMERSEYKKLVKCFNEQSKHFRLIESFLHMPKIVRKDFEEDTVFAWIDIIVYDFISEKSLAQKAKIGISLAFQAMCRDKETIQLTENKGHGKLKMLFFRMAYLMGRMFSYEQKYGAYNRFCENRLCGNRTKMYRSNDNMVGMKMIIQTDWLDEYIDTEFENHNFMVMKKYHEVLVSCYGKNYMVPIQDNSKEDLHLNFKKAFISHLEKIA